MNLYLSNNKAFKRLYSNVKKKKDYKKRKRGKAYKTAPNNRVSLSNDSSQIEHTTINNIIINNKNEPPNSKSAIADITGIISVVISILIFIYQLLFKN